MMRTTGEAQATRTLIGIRERNPRTDGAVDLAEARDTNRVSHGKREDRGRVVTARDEVIEGRGHGRPDPVFYATKVAQMCHVGL